MAAPPSPSPSPLSHSSAHPPGWHFPFGPSSRYHQRERPKPTRKSCSTTYTSVAPVLATERRAHTRRTQSHTTNLTPRRALRRAQSQHPSHTAPLDAADSPTPPASEHTPSPLHRFTSHSTAAMAGRVTTPAQSTASHFDLRLQDSPFSDYFSQAGDDARSVGVQHDPKYAGYNDTTAGAAPYEAPSPETQQLLVRLGALQAQLMRGSAGEGVESDVLNIVGRKVGELEVELEALHSQTRLPADLEDSGLFMDEEDEHPPAHAEAARPISQQRLHTSHSLRSTHPHDDGEPTAENTRAERDYQLLEAQRVLETVTRAQEELRRRHAELVRLNDDLALQIEEREREAEDLRVENERLVGDRCRSDRHETSTRRKRGRRSSYLDPLLEQALVDMEASADLGDDNGGANWRVEAMFESGGKVESITLRRRRGDDDGSQNTQPDVPRPAFQPVGGLDGAADEKAEADVGGATSHGSSSHGEEAEQAPDGLTLPSTHRIDSAQHTLPDDQPTDDPAKVLGPGVECVGQGTQTDEVDKVIPRQSDEEQGVEDVDDDTDDHANGTERDDDCAITTSASTPVASPLIQPLSKSQSQSAWAELWEGLGQLAGVGEGIEE